MESRDRKAYEFEKETLHLSQGLLKERKLEGFEAFETETLEISRRLLLARQNRGFESSERAAVYLGINARLYARHENGQKHIRTSQLMFYAKKFNVEFEWLLRGRGNDPFPPELQPNPRPDPRPNYPAPSTFEKV